MQKTLLIGNLGNDPELRYTTQNQTPVCSFSVATTEYWKDSEGKQQSSTEWHPIIAWRAQAEFCANRLTKGMKVYIEGKNKTRKWNDQNGVEHSKTEIHLTFLEPLSKLTPLDSDNRGTHDDTPLPPHGYSGDDVPF